MSPWRCPSCANVIAHKGDKPKPGVHYRCHQCRVGLEYHEGSEQLIVRSQDDRRRMQRTTPERRRTPAQKS
jgi:hypothetical protein